MCISGEKNLETIWQELEEEFREDIQWLNLTKNSIWNAARDRETNRPLTEAESKLTREGLNRETIPQTRFWRLRPGGIVFRPPTESKTVIFCILEFKRMSDITDQYLIRARSRAENQYASLRRALGETIQRQGWRVEQISFIAGSRSLNEDDLRKNLKFFQVPEASIEDIGSKLALRISKVQRSHL